MPGARELTRDAGPAAWVVTPLLIGALVLCAFMRTERYWPLSEWKLFSEMRKADQRGWMAASVVGSEEAPIEFDDLPRTFHGAAAILQEFPRLTPGQRDAVCTAWADALDDQGVRPSAIRVYRTTTHYFLDGRPPRVARTPAYVCDTS